ncbi:hypothetical protein DFS34DRAFT_645444 [Phlyctochytrium arcticum]|nr:hypothetical protein DFS34DRAFT_645444 [Phlyctochytrium arcticum]
MRHLKESAGHRRRVWQSNNLDQESAMIEDQKVGVDDPMDSSANETSSDSVSDPGVGGEEAIWDGIATFHRTSWRIPTVADLKDNFHPAHQEFRRVENPDQAGGAFHQLNRRPIMTAARAHLLLPPLQYLYEYECAHRPQHIPGQRTPPRTLKHVKLSPERTSRGPDYAQFGFWAPCQTLGHRMRDTRFLFLCPALLDPNHSCPLSSHTSRDDPRLG